MFEEITLNLKVKKQPLAAFHTFPLINTRIMRNKECFSK